MYNRLYNWYSIQSTMLKGIITFCSTLLLIYMSYLITMLIVIRMGNIVMKPLYASDNSLTQAVKTVKKPRYFPAEQYQIFQTQYAIMSLRKQHHLKLALIFFRNYYSVLILTMFTSCIGGVTLFVMINKGWATAGITLQAFFLGLVCAITYLGLFPLVFKQHENFADNMKFYQDYSKSQLTIYSQLGIIQSPNFCQRTDTLDQAKRLYLYVRDPVLIAQTIDTMLLRNHAVINGLTNYVFTIDPKQLKSISDVYRTISAATLGKDTLKNN